MINLTQREQGILKRAIYEGSVKLLDAQDFYRSKRDAKLALERLVRYGLLCQAVIGVYAPTGSAEKGCLLGWVEA